MPRESTPAPVLRLDWEDIVWKDPDGGELHLHGVLPTVVYPDRLRSSREWNSYALLVPVEEIELWEHEEEMERESPGINLDEALIGGGDFSKLLQGLSTLEGIQIGKFPDPEPRRLQRMAVRRASPLYFIEPSLSDEDWSDWHERRAVEITHPWALLSRIWSGRRFRSKFKSVIPSTTSPAHCSSEFALASALSAAWWLAEEHSLSDELRNDRDTRFASRLRGALVDTVDKDGPSATLLVVCHQAQRASLLAALNLLPDAEVPLCTTGSSAGDGELQ